MIIFIIIFIVVYFPFHIIIRIIIYRFRSLIIFFPRRSACPSKSSSNVTLATCTKCSRRRRRAIPFGTFGSRPKLVFQARETHTLNFFCMKYIRIADGGLIFRFVALFCFVCFLLSKSIVSILMVTQRSTEGPGDSLLCICLYFVHSNHRSHQFSSKV